MSEYAGLVSRSAAYLVDAVVVTVLTGTSAMVFVLVALFVGADAQDLAGLVVSSVVVFLPALLALYCAFFWMLAGRTPGMAVFGLRVVDRDGRPPRWLAAMVRGLLLAYLPVLALWLLVDRRHRGLHDKVARTSVVRALTRRG
ncbi:RDD family protein [Actinoplanes sp. NEAU-A12]|uniref:RDD family protein n=1 Tax=Actinoplanes sandaracinus TaxID=3045177 RepID=A0ABT6WZQ0_9ACTN|nr:RDD family protein [Actinoplanes sandaracinus]MDI6105228.1 RDD family protein [Actinoplanes sandaracinus]